MMLIVKGHAAGFSLVAPLIVAGMVVLLVGLAVLGVLLQRRYERLARAELERILGEAGTYAVRGSGDPAVDVRFHTYRGVLFWTTQTEHRFAAPLSRSWYLLDRLHWFNLKWNWRNPGAWWIPILSWANRFAQRRRILRQAREQGWEG